MLQKRIKLSSLIESQLPSFVRNQYPLFAQFLEQYFLSVDSKSLPFDIAQNIDKYIKLDEIFSVVNETILTEDINPYSDIIKVESTNGFSDTYGLLLIDDEIITYKTKTDTEFLDCVRGFSGVKSYTNDVPDMLSFVETEAANHLTNSVVKNLNVLFLQQFLYKIKKQISPGFENRLLFENLNERLFLKQSKDFYISKGTSRSFNILFGALYGNKPKIILPQEQVIETSSAIYRTDNDIVVELIDGSPLSIINSTLYQDADDIIPSSARGTINNVEKITRNNKDFYILSLDYDFDKDLDVDGSIKGKFYIHPKTYITSNTPKNSTFIDVDSTLGFPESGNLNLMLDNGIKLNISYERKTSTQFLDCSGVIVDVPSGIEIFTPSYAYAYDNDNNIVKLRITGVISDLNVYNSELTIVDDNIRTVTLGKSIDDVRTNTLKYNIATWHNIKSISLIDISDNTYSISTYDINYYYTGDQIIITGNNSQIINGNIIDKKNDYILIIKSQFPLNELTKYKIQKVITKVNSKNYTELNKFSSNVLNSYVDSSNSVYINSSSLPYFYQNELFINDRTIIFSGTFDGYDLQLKNSNGTVLLHNYYTGDIVYYYSTSDSPITNIGIYYVKVINSTTIRFAKSRENIDQDKFVLLSGNSNNDYIFYSKFLDKNNILKPLESQNIEKKYLNLFLITKKMLPHLVVPLEYLIMELNSIIINQQI